MLFGRTPPKNVYQSALYALNHDAKFRYFVVLERAREMFVTSPVYFSTSEKHKTTCFNDLYEAYLEQHGDNEQYAQRQTQQQQQQQRQLANYVDEKSHAIALMLSAPGSKGVFLHEQPKPSPAVSGECTIGPSQLRKQPQPSIGPQLWQAPKPLQATETQQPQPTPPTLPPPPPRASLAVSDKCVIGPKSQPLLAMQPKFGNIIGKYKRRRHGSSSTWSPPSPSSSSSSSHRGGGGKDCLNVHSKGQRGRVYVSFNTTTVHCDGGCASARNAK